ncbi:MAG TPA: hypothetical protein PLE48_00885 [Thiobacillus sp.]|nr:MAG: hypothetical protein B7Y50_13875 [Hydrogenophilales bacterium 28-61-11]OYZ58044.1 MAG: hypothetical protein B7Y21_05085 [Hydrogenophilales bacterium 16-61-112]OZA50343.1 MAG: hypothetical protein B7X81_01755 [Hydrogenophilales bacterium 17-61-76]HQT30423.1 hypothetical protein [Thiobacillus sp.]HQT68965.1 hypothetical protein [Thiobacillus sp.]
MIEVLPVRHSEKQLQRITDEAMIYMCACPAQVANQLLSLRELYSYQQTCINDGPLNIQVHARIAEATRKAHAVLEQCLDKILDLEGWDRTTLTMPESLRQLRDQVIDNESN